jgi:hypothetical protein
VLTCRTCLIQYVGETEQTLAARINGHKEGLRSGSTEEYLHFNCDEAHRSLPINEKFKVQIAEKIYDDDEPNKLKAKERRLERELAWMLRLQTVFPLGLNTRIKGLGIVNHPGRHKLYNLYSLSASFDKNYKVAKRSKRRRIQNRIRDEDVQRFILDNKDIDNSVFIKEIRNKSRKFLKRCCSLAEFAEFSEGKRKLVTDWIQYTSQTDQNTRKKEKKLYFGVEFLHKTVQRINIRRIFGEKAVKDLIPKGSVYSSQPLFYYKYGKNIGQKILNYNKVSREATFKNFEEINQMT